MTDHALPASLRFMIAAGQRELASLGDLVTTCELVTLVSQLVHDLQKERGWSTIWLGEARPDRLDTLNDFSVLAERSETEMRRCLDSMDIEGGAGRPRLLARTAHALDALDGLPRLRRQIREQAIASADSTAAFSRLVGGLLSMVFEASDAGLDAGVSRALVAMFNFMQGKELAGQERAAGAAGFTSGFFDDGRKALMQRLREDQQRCFAAFADHVGDGGRALWQQLLDDPVAAELQRLRAVADRTSAQSRVAGALAELWFDVCSRQIDRMKEVENLLADELLQSCRQRIARAREELDNRRMLSRRITQLADAQQPLVFRVQASTLGDGVAEGGSEELNRSILDRVRDQALRLQQLDDELAKAREALEQRRRIDLAKRRLEQEAGLSEQAAHERMQRESMESGVGLAEIARRILS